MDRNQQIAAGITFLICCCLLIWLVVAKLAWDPVIYPPQPRAEITMAVADDEEFVEVEVMKPNLSGDEQSAPAMTPTELNNESQPAPQSGPDLTSQGEVGTPKQTVTQRRESSVKETAKPSPAKPASAIDRKAEEEKALAQRSNNTVSNAFANANNKNNALNGKKDEGNAGKPDGNPDSAASPSAKGTKAGSTEGTVGGNWRMPAYSRNIPSNEVGEVTFEVVVNKDGSVGKITQISAKGLTSDTISRCRAEIQRHRFTHASPETAEATTARITFRFRDPV